MRKNNILKEKWLDTSKNCYKNISNIYKCKNYAMKMICLPQFPLDNNMNYPKTFENSIITVGNDRNIRCFPIVNDS